MSMDGYKFELDAAQLSDSVISSNALSIRALLARGQPLSVAVFGASVAVHGGCAHQPEAECMNYNGQVTVALGGKRPAPLKGFMVHFMEWLNSSWPHPQHSLMNLARGGTALQTALPCLFGKLPPTIDLAVLELGSMAKWLDAASIEILTRKLLALPSSPALDALRHRANVVCCLVPLQPAMRARPPISNRALTGWRRWPSGVHFREC